MDPWPMRAIFKDDSLAKDTGVFKVNLRIGTLMSPCVADVGAIVSSGVKSTASAYSRMPAVFVVKGGTLANETNLGVSTENELVPLMRAPSVTCSPGSCTPLLFRSRKTGAKGLMS